MWLPTNLNKRLTNLRWYDEQLYRWLINVVFFLGVIAGASTVTFVVLLFT